MDSKCETSKRLEVALEIVETFKDISTGAILGGSVAYAPNLRVTSKSDVDKNLTLPFRARSALA